MSWHKLSTIILAIFFLASFARAQHTVNYKLKMKYQLPFGSSTITLTQGSFLEGEKLTFPPVDLTGSMAVYNNYFDAIEGAYFLFDEGALNEDIFIDIILKGLDRSTGLPGAVHGQPMFINFDVIVKVHPDSPAVEGHYYFNADKYFHFYAYKSDSFKALIGNLGLDPDALAFAYITETAFDSEDIYFENTVDYAHFWAAHLSEFGGGPSSITALEDEGVSNNLPVTLNLYQNYPNPFNPSTTIKYTLGETGPVSLKIYSITGQEIATLVSGEQKAGTYTINFNAEHLANGVYFYRLESSQGSLSRRMILMK